MSGRKNPAWGRGSHPDCFEGWSVKTTQGVRKQAGCMQGAFTTLCTCCVLTPREDHWSLIYTHSSGLFVFSQLPESSSSSVIKTVSCFGPLDTCSTALAQPVSPCLTCYSMSLNLSPPSCLRMVPPPRSRRWPLRSPKRSPVCWMGLCCKTGEERRKSSSPEKERALGFSF